MWGKLETDGTNVVCFLPRKQSVFRGQLTQSNWHDGNAGHTDLQRVQDELEQLGDTFSMCPHLVAIQAIFTDRVLWEWEGGGKSQSMG